MTSPNTAEPTARPEPSQAPPSPPAAAAGTGNRLAWLDVLRGLAALAVVFNHFGYFVPAALKNPVNHWVDSGAYGVFVFFLISGYIVPAIAGTQGQRTDLLESAGSSASTRCTCSPSRSR